MRFHQGGKHSDEYFSRYFTTEDKLSCLRPRVHRVFVPGSKAPSVLYDNSMWTATAAGWWWSCMVYYLFVSSVRRMWVMSWPKGDKNTVNIIAEPGERKRAGWHHRSLSEEFTVLTKDREKASLTLTQSTSLVTWWLKWFKLDFSCFIISQNKSFIYQTTYTLTPMWSPDMSRRIRLALLTTAQTSLHRQEDLTTAALYPGGSNNNHLK